MRRWLCRPSTVVAGSTYPSNMFVGTTTYERDSNSHHNGPLNTFNTSGLGGFNGVSDSAGAHQSGSDQGTLNRSTRTTS